MTHIIRARISILSALTPNLSMNEFDATHRANSEQWSIEHALGMIFYKCRIAIYWMNPSCKKSEKKTKNSCPGETLSRFFGLAPRVAFPVERFHEKGERGESAKRESKNRNRRVENGSIVHPVRLYAPLETERWIYLARIQPFIYLASCPRAGCAYAFSPFQRISPQNFQLARLFPL